MQIIKVMRRKKRANSPQRLKLPYKLPVEITDPMFPYVRFGYLTGFGYSSSNEYSEASSKYSTQSSEKQVSRHGNSCCVVAEFTAGTLFLSFTDSVFHARVENSIKLILAINIDYYSYQH